jgi:uncharacterized membrane protein
MRTWLSLAAVAGLMVVGCNKSPEGGTPGTSATFKISAPTIPTSIKQGDKETLKFSLDRGKDFKHDVKLSVKHPDKIKAELNKTEIKASEGTDFNVTVDVAKDAPLGDAVITVTGTPEGGGTPTSVDVKVHVTGP